MDPTGVELEPSTMSLPQRLSWRSARRLWDHRAPEWHHVSTASLQRVVDAVLDLAGGAPGMTVVDLGCGSGQLSLPLARGGARVTAIDISPVMIDLLQKLASNAGLENLAAQVAPIERFDLPAESVDLVVSNYALHHLRDRDKALVVTAAARWLRPGGTLVVGDMMFGRGATKRDRDIIASKVSLMLRRGPAGWVRLAKNLVRFGLRVRERPVAMATWTAYFEASGLTGVSARAVVAEAGVVVGHKP